MRRTLLPCALFATAIAFFVGCGDSKQPVDQNPGADASADSTPDVGVDAAVPDTTAQDTTVPDAADSEASVPLEGCANAESLRTTCEGTLPENFDASTVLAKGCYRAAKTPKIASGVTLTLAAGVTIIFAESTELLLGGDQALVVAGTEEEPVCLTGAKAERGAWRGVILGSTTDPFENKLDWLTVEYAGDTTADTKSAAVKLVSDSKPVALSMSHTTLRESEGFGLWLIASAEISSFGNNTMVKNTLGPASVDSNVTGVLDAASIFKGNDRDQIEVRANAIQEQKMATWAALDVPYFIDGNLTTDVEWAISAGATLIISEGSELRISGNTAAMSADGTVDKPILITGEKAERGSWGGIIFTNAANPKNRLTYVTVEHAGDDVGQDDVADVVLTGTGFPVSVAISHCTLRESKGYGLSLTRMSELPNFEANTFTKNTKGPVWTASDSPFAVLPC